jgi:ribonuclease H2 subunit A
MSDSQIDPLVGTNYAFWGEEVEIGIDEAGRGPVLGPMVYGAAFWPARDLAFSKDMKKRYGFEDSKKLTEKQREAIFKLINETRYKDIGYFVSVLSAEFLSNSMLADWDKGGRNLNKLSHDTAIDLIKKIRGVGFTVKRVYLDTVGDPKKYKAIVENALQDDSI